MIKASIRTRDGTGRSCTLELPMDRLDMYLILGKHEITTRPDMLRLNPRSDDAPEITLTGENELDSHIISIAGKYTTLAEINRAIDVVGYASEHILPSLYQRIVNDDFATFAELETGIDTMTWEAGTETVSFYYPLVGELDEHDDDYGCREPMPVSSRYLAGYEEDIRISLMMEQQRDPCNMVSYMDCGEDLRDKLIAMRWDVEMIGDTLYGRTDVRIAQPLTTEETEAVKDYILGQNSDGLGEGYEQRPLAIDDGALYVSMWNSGDDYFICSKDELDEHIDQSSGQGFGSMT